ncbi:16S rRNA (cytosine(967)-C(5))-methyltransferase RsmB [Methylomonas sp. SURF-2]|uniref:16S rRNA (cytosine(967)-C(5))-methyltransferase n=1 Tax=Methylomonas subterranea TaxID=2952225 RepID=A0ABT1TK79_9GAMM|nr:16S rRNA (cytosine(967)-C(5))-methyltransferase RsmB [Methylomonas sp. SURF-2]MCQ8105877.1 16S rRNA (cytosine(967)-C(5))-methyltransferase RsmB [Methylomonas sp. SURF-2]
MNLRGCAAQILSRVIGDGQSLTAALDSQLPKLKDHQDRAFAQAICYGVIRHYFALDCLLGHLLDKALKAKDGDIKALLLVGLYQLQYMRVKPHAAVSETVAATKHKPWSKGLVNAVLRRYLRDSETLAAQCATDRQAELNHPRWLIEQIETNWPEQYRHILAANDLPPPMALRVNLRQNSREDYLRMLNQQGMAAQVVAHCPTALILDEAMNVDQLPGFAEGRVSVQDVAAQLAAGLLDAQAGDRVLDICAAPGGKTAAILERQPGLQSLLAVDIDAGRLQRVTDNLHRLQLHAETLAADAANPQDWAAGQLFDRILLDAPCSGFGVIRRHPDIKLLRRESDIAALRALQAQILGACWDLLAPGGTLLYATCSILKQENEQQIAAFLNRHADARELVISADWGQPRPHGRQILTGDRRMDGFYYAKLGKAV